MQMRYIALTVFAALISSAAAVRPVLNSVDIGLESRCPLSHGWTRAELAPQAIAKVNEACPSAAGVPLDRGTCIPCLCGAFHLFKEALDSPMTRLRFHAASAAASLSMTGEVFSTCINQHAGIFKAPSQAQAGLRDCLLSIDGVITVPQLSAMCDSFNSHALTAGVATSTDNTKQEEAVAAKDEHNIRLLQAIEADPPAAVSPIQPSPEMDAEISAEMSGEMSSEISSEMSGEQSMIDEASGEMSTGGEPFPAVNVGSPPTEGALPAPSRDVAGSLPAPPPPGSSAGITMSHVMPMVMAMVSAILLATMMA